MLTNTVEALLHSELVLGERLLWSGQPHASGLPRRRNLLTIPTGLFWGVLALNLVVRGFIERDAASLLTCGLPAGLFALFLVAWPFVADSLMRRRTIYALTDRRILIVTDAWRHQVRALNLRTLNEVQLSLDPNGRGTLSFGAVVHPFGAMATAWPMGGRFGPTAFDDIEQPRAVYEQIHAAQAQLLERG